MTPECIALGEAIAASGFTVHLPLLFGEPGDNHPVFFIAKLCISREFRLFASGGGSPIVDWLRALCRKVKADCGGLGVGAIGLCLTGNFAISLMADDSVLALTAVALRDRESARRLFVIYDPFTARLAIVRAYMVLRRLPEALNAATALSRDVPEWKRAALIASELRDYSFTR